MKIQFLIQLDSWINHQSIQSNFEPNSIVSVSEEVNISLVSMDLSKLTQLTVSNELLLTQKPNGLFVCVKIYFIIRMHLFWNCLNLSVKFI